MLCLRALEYGTRFQDGQSSFQDGYLSLNRALATATSKRTRTKLVAIPPRSLDLDLIKSIFHIQKWTVEQDAIEKSITFKTYRQFSACIMTTLKKPTPKFN